MIKINFAINMQFSPPAISGKTNVSNRKERKKQSEPVTLTKKSKSRFVPKLSDTELYLT